MSGILDWLFGPPAAQPARQSSFDDRKREWKAAGGNCVAWIDPQGKIHDKKCNYDGPASVCAELPHLRRGRLTVIASARAFEHEATAQRRAIKGRSKHASSMKRAPVARYHDLVRVAKQAAEENCSSDLGRLWRRR